MPRPLLTLLAELLAPGRLRVGQIEIRRVGEGFDLRHEADLARDDLEDFQSPHDARHLSMYDEAGVFRPLKTAPNLRRGWRLRLASLEALHLALDLFYPAMLGVLRDFLAGKLPPVTLRETLGRQTGMYAITRKITDEQAQQMIGDFCRSATGCLKKILWEIAPGVPVTTLPPEKFKVAQDGQELPLLCHESCNLLVAKARDVVKSVRAST